MSCGDTIINPLLPYKAETAAAKHVNEEIPIYMIVLIKKKKKNSNLHDRKPSPYPICTTHLVGLTLNNYLNIHSL